MPRQNPSVQRQSSDPLETCCSGPCFPCSLREREEGRWEGKRKGREKRRKARGGGGGAEEQMEGTTEGYIDQALCLLLFFEDDSDSACI